VTTPKSSLTIGPFLLNAVVLPASLLAWVGVIVLALLETPNEANLSAFDALTRIVLAGNQ